MNDYDLKVNPETGEVTRAPVKPTGPAGGSDEPVAYMVCAHDPSDDDGLFFILDDAKRFAEEQQQAAFDDGEEWADSIVPLYRLNEQS